MAKPEKVVAGYGMIHYVVAEVMNLIVHEGQKNHNNLLGLVVGRAA